MEYRMQASFNHTAEIAASTLPGLRLVTVAKVQSPTPLSDATLETYGWGVSSPATLNDLTHQKEPFGYPFSSTCYFFGRSLHLALKQQVPIGLIASSWGGCPIQPWMRADALAKCGLDATEALSVARQAGPATNGKMFNAMMAPLKNLKLSGMLWVRSPIIFSCLLVLVSMALSTIAFDLHGKPTHHFWWYARRRTRGRRIQTTQRSTTACSLRQLKIGGTSGTLQPCPSSSFKSARVPPMH
eukprot:COSAG02_NODE_3091_length_7386_cov_7.913682_2_plen_242_part_00